MPGSPTDTPTVHLPQRHSKGGASGEGIRDSGCHLRQPRLHGRAVARASGGERSRDHHRPHRGKDQARDRADRYESRHKRNARTTKEHPAPVECTGIAALSTNPSERFDRTGERMKPSWSACSEGAVDSSAQPAKRK
jgi:hypothetical protein